MMTKLIYSSAFDKCADVSMHIIEDPAALTKSAGTVFGLDYDALKPDDTHVGIHVTALGDWEHYGANRNGDTFPKAACVKYHDTFVKHGQLFRHHKNKDRSNNLGNIKASAYNADMGRIELFVHANKERARDELQRLEKEGEIPFSMACFRAGTLIVTRTGPKKIEDIQQGDQVLTHTGRWYPVGNRSTRETTEYVVVNTVSWGRTALEVTGNHPFFAASTDQFLRTRKDSPLHAGKEYRRRHRSELHHYLAWVPADELTAQHYIGVPIDRIETEDMSVSWARVLGYYIAEGSFGKGVTQFTCNIEDDAVVELPSLAPWTSSTVTPHSASDKAVSVNCFGTELRDKIEELCGRRGENKVVPITVQHAFREVKFNFVAAWFNGDGWQDSYGMHWSTHYQGLAVDLQRLLASLDIPSSCCRVDHPEDRGIVVSKDAVEYVVSISNQYSEVFADISKAETIEICGATKCRTFISGNYLMVPVKSVAKVAVPDPVLVYNFSVAGDESYTVHGLAVHNCRVPGDRCTICNNFRKNAADPNMCDHIRYELGKVFDDGKIAATHNDDPEFFDLSFVGRPADRIAWNLKLAAGEVVDSVKLAEVEGIYVPDYMAIESASGKAKLDYLKKMAVLQDDYRKWEKTACVTPTEKYFYELKKAADVRFSDGIIAELRKLEPVDAFRALAKAGCVMDIESFFKYATGPAYVEIASLMPEIKQLVPAVIRQAVKEGYCQTLCNETLFDVSAARYDRVPVDLMQKLAEASIVGPVREERIITATLSGNLPKFAVDSNVEIGHSGVEKVALAEKYAAYKLSAVHAILGSHTDTDVDSVVAIVAAQNLL